MKRDWHRDGSDLRGRIAALPDGSVPARGAAPSSGGGGSDTSMDERGSDAPLHDRNGTGGDRAAREAQRRPGPPRYDVEAEYARQRALSGVSKERLRADARGWERRAAEAEAQASAAQHKALQSDAQSHSLNAELSVTKEQVRALRAQLRRAEEEIRVLQARLVKLHAEREEERRMWRIEVSKCEAEAIAQRQHVEAERQAKSAEAVAARATALTLERRLARRDDDVKRMIADWDAREAELAADLHAQLRRAVTAEAERDAAREEVARLRMVAESSSKELTGIFTAVTRLAGEDAATDNPLVQADAVEAALNQATTAAYTPGGGGGSPYRAFGPHPT